MYSPEVQKVHNTSISTNLSCYVLHLHVGRFQRPRHAHNHRQRASTRCRRSIPVIINCSPEVMSIDRINESTTTAKKSFQSCAYIDEKSCHVAKYIISEKIWKHYWDIVTFLCFISITEVFWTFCTVLRLGQNDRVVLGSFGVQWSCVWRLAALSK